MTSKNGRRCIWYTVCMQTLNMVLGSDHGTLPWMQKTSLVSLCLLHSCICTWENKHSCFRFNLIVFYFYFYLFIYFFFCFRFLNTHDILYTRNLLSINWVSKETCQFSRNAMYISAIQLFYIQASLNCLPISKTITYLSDCRVSNSLILESALYIIW